MKKLLTFLLVLFSAAALSQTPTVIQRSPSSVVPVDQHLFVKSLKIPVYQDTAHALAAAGIDSIGLFFKELLTSKVYVRDTCASGGHQWDLITGLGGGGGSFDSLASQGGGFHTDAFNRLKYKQIADSGNGNGSNYQTIAGDQKTIDSMKAVNDAKYLIKTGATPGQVAIANGSGVVTPTTVTNDVTFSSSGVSTIGANAVTNAKAAQMPANTIKGNNTAGLANQSDLTAAQVAAMLPTFTTSANGLVPQSVTSNTTDYLRRDGSWATPPGTGGTTFANPTGTIGLTAVNGAAITAMRSDAAPPLSQSIVPTWTGVHTFSTLPVLGTLGGYIKGSAGSLSASTTIPTTDLTGTLQVGQEPAHSGDVTNSAGSLALTITNNAVTNAKAAQMGATTIKANVTGSTANATDATPAQINTILPTFTSSLNGLVPFPGGSPTGAKVLADNGTWVTAGGSSLATASGDATGTVSGTNLPLSVVKIQGTPVSSTAPTIGQIQVYDPGTGQYNPTNGGYLIGDTTMKLRNYTYDDAIFPAGKTINNLGHSWTAGSGASTTATRWTAVLASVTGATENNLGVAGMTLLTQGLGNNYQGAPSMIQRLSFVPTNTTGTACITVEFGLNDIVNLPGYTLTNFSSAYDTLLRHIIDTSHFKRREVVLMGIEWIPDAALTYYGTISGVTAPSRARLLQFDSVIQAVAMRWGVWYVPNYYPLKDNMNDSSHYVLTGSLHVDDFGHKFVANTVIQKLGLQTGSPVSQSGFNIVPNLNTSNIVLGTNTATSTTTPVFFDQGATFAANVSARQLKHYTYRDNNPNNNFGFSVSSGLFGLWGGGASTHFKFFLNADSTKPYVDLSSSSLAINFMSVNSLTLGSHTLSSVTSPDFTDLGGTVATAVDSSKLKLFLYTNGTSRAGLGITTTSIDYWTPHGLPHTFHYDATSALKVDKFLTAANYASFGNGSLYDSTNYKPLVVNQTTGAVSQTYWSGFAGSGGSTPKIDAVLNAGAMSADGTWTTGAHAVKLSGFSRDTTGFQRLLMVVNDSSMREINTAQLAAEMPQDTTDYTNSIASTTISPTHISVALVNDVSSPGANAIYGTDNSGTRNWIGPICGAYVPTTGSNTNVSSVTFDSCTFTVTNRVVTLRISGSINVSAINTLTTCTFSLPSGLSTSFTGQQAGSGTVFANGGQNPFTTFSTIGSTSQFQYYPTVSGTSPFSMVLQYRK